MARATYRLQGEKKFYKTLAKLDVTVEKEGGKVVLEQAEAIAKDIKSSWSPYSPSPAGHAPASGAEGTTGALDSSVRVDKNVRNAKGNFATMEKATMAIVRFDTSGNTDRERGNYAQPLELGVHSGNRGQRIEPRPFVAPAMDRHVKEFKMAVRWETLNGAKI